MGGERAFVAGHDIRRRGISDATGLWQKKRHLADTWCYPPPRLRCGCWEAFLGPSPIAERVGQVDSWARYRTRHGRVWPVLLADRAQGPGSLFQDDRKLHEQQMLHGFWLSLLRQERYIRSMRKDLRSDCEQFVQSLERNLAAGARLHEASEVALLLLCLRRRHWITEAKLREGAFDRAARKEGEHLCLRCIRCLQRRRGFFGRRLRDQEGRGCHGRLAFRQAKGNWSLGQHRHFHPGVEGDWRGECVQRPRLGGQGGP